MINNEFLKKLTILYVEDEDLAREQFGKSLRRLFKNVILASNGEDGYNKFQEARLASQPIDLILSDINMPKMNGLEMLEKIRKIDQNVPVMYTTARTEIEYIQRAIELNVYHYALKPINLDEIIEKIQKVCEKQYFQMVIDSKNNELKNYLTIINNVAAIYKINEKGEITFINNLLCELFQGKKEDLIGKDFRTLFHSQTSKDLSEDILSTIINDATWSGDIKYENSLNEPFYIRSTLFKLAQEHGTEYISIGFLSTEDVEKQRKFHQSVLLSISSKNQEASKSKNELDSLHEENNLLKEKSYLYTDQVKKFQEKISFFKNQIKHYETELASVDERIEKKMSIRKQAKDSLAEEVTKLKKDNRLLLTKNDQLEITGMDNLKEIEKLKNEIVQKEKRIDAINDILEHRESQIRKLNPDLL
jgi:CheY-like chemotaxis protein